MFKATQGAGTGSCFQYRGRNRKVRSKRFMVGRRFEPMSSDASTSSGCFSLDLRVNCVLVYPSLILSLLFRLHRIQQLGTEFQVLPQNEDHELRSVESTCGKVSSTVPG